MDALAGGLPAGGAAADEEDVAEVEDSTIYNDYECKSLGFGVRHPSQIAEPRGLAAVSLPDPWYPLRDTLDPFQIIATGKLSSLQLEGVLYACQRHQLMLAGGIRAGFFLGDGAGVGKGRQIAGMIADNLARGRKAHVWLSTSSDLRLDAERDLKDLGIHCKVIDGCQDLDTNTKALGLSSDFKDGVLFSTYSTLIGGARGSKSSRIDQIIKWCGGEGFDGLLVFDECHRAKNFQVGEKEDASTKTSKCVIELQKRLPLARVVYASATGVTELGNLAYCERLGLWGEGCPFADFESFLKVVSKKGIFFLEMLAMELKREGAYVSRGLSFKNAEFETLTVALTPAQIQVYDQAAALWRDLRVRMQEAAALTNASGRLMSLYWGSHQRFFKQLIVSLKVGTVVEEAKKGLEAGLAVVIGLQLTGEASMARKINQNGCGDGLNAWLSSARESMLALIQDHFPTIVQAATKGKEGGAGVDDVGFGTQGWGPGGILSSQATPHKDMTFSGLGGREGGSGLTEGSTVAQCVTWKEELLQRVSELDLPGSALDVLIDELGGPQQVAEMTGRSHRMVRKDGGKFAYEQRGKSDGDLERVNVTECRAFQDGKKLVGIISDAASVGISLHAKKDGKNERRRMHLTIELPWSADKAVQQLGRTHRSNQSSAPMYKLVVSELGGEKRFVSAVARRLQSLGALTKGDRRAASGQDLQEFNLQTAMGTAALKKVFASIDEGIVLPLKGPGENTVYSDKMEDLQRALDFIDLGLGRKEQEAGNVGRFLGRLLGLSVEVQNTLFNYFMDCLSHDIAVAEKEGHYSDAIRDCFFGASVKLERSEEFYTNPITSASCSVHTLVVDRGFSWEHALARLQQSRNAATGDGKGEVEGEAVADGMKSLKGGFYETKNFVPGRNATGWILAIQKEASPGEYTVWRPNTGASTSTVLAEDLKFKYISREQDAAETAWRRIYDESKTWDVDREKGARCLTVRLLSGSLIPVWDHIHEVVQRASLRGGSGVTSSQADMKVVRMTADGNHYIGLRLPSKVISAVKKQLDAHNDLLLGKVLQVTLEPKTLAAIPALIAQHYSFPGDYKGRAHVGSDACDIILRVHEGKVTLGIPHKGTNIPHVAPRGENGMFVSHAPFFVPVPVQAGDCSVKGAKMEEVTSVNARALKRAMTPAPTMLSFFGAKTKPPPGEPCDSNLPSCAIAAQQKRSATDFFSPHGSQQSRSSQGSSSKKPRVAPTSSQRNAGIGAFFSANATASAGKDKVVAEIDLTED